MGRTSNPTTGFGGVVRQLRKESGLTQAQLAERVKTTAGHVAKIELNYGTMPDRKTVERLARALGVPPMALVEAGGHVPPEIAKAYAETPEEMLWFSQQSRKRRRELSGGGETDGDREERDRIRRLARRLARG